MQHKIAIFAYATPYFWVLLIPIARTVFLLGFDFKNAFGGAQYDLIAIIALFLYGFLKWRLTVFEVKRHELVIKSGFILRTKTVIGMREITAITLERTLILRYFSATRVRICSNSSERALELYCRNDQLEQFYPHESLSSPRDAKWYSVLFYSLLNSSSLSGALILSASVSQLGRILGIRLDEQMISGIEDFGSRLRLGLPPLFVTAALIILISWAVSFLKNAIDIGRFSIKQRGGKIVITSGIFNLYTNFLTSSKVNSLDIRRNMLSLVTRSGTPYIHCTGYGSGKSELSVAFPSCRNKVAAEITSCFFSRFTPQPPEVKPPKRAFFGYIALPLGWLAFFALALTAAILFLNIMFLRYICGVCVLVFLWLIVVRTTAFFHCGITVGESVIFMSTVRYFALHSVSLRRSSVAYFEILRNPFQRVSGLCDIVICELSAKGRKKHKIRNIEYKIAKKLRM